MKNLLNTLYILTPDRYLSLDGENAVINSGGSPIARVPLHNLERIMVFGYSGASPALMGKCVQEGIELVFMKPNGSFLARVEGGVSGNVILRRQQYRIADDKERSLAIARIMISGKIFNAKQSAERTARDHSLRIDPEKFSTKAGFLKSSVNNALKAATADELRGIEGEAASVYFSLLDDMILQQERDFKFTVRSKRPPLDNVNAMLSFAYSLATGMCCSALESVGLDPYVGFFHTDRPGKRSLALDLVEEFRVPMCDRFVLSLINKKIVTNKDFTHREDGAVLLTDDGRKTFIQAWQKRKDEIVTHPYLKEKMKWGLLPYVQALLLARLIRGDIDMYPVFMWK